MKSDEKYKRVVVKIGSGVLTSGQGGLDRRTIEELSRQVAGLMDRGIETVVVSSGAIAAGMAVLKMSERPKALQELQACAAVGQSQLMRAYEGSLKAKGYVAAQILLTQEDLGDRKRYLNAKNTIVTLLKEKTVPIINENDTISTEEIKFGDNDRLSSLVANLIESDLLVMLSTVEGLCEYDDSRKKVIRCVGLVEKITQEIEALAHPEKSASGTGGMVSKIQAAKVAVRSGIPCIIASGAEKDILIKIADGMRAGTLFLACGKSMSARKHWIAYTSKPKGVVKVDNGARTALVSGMKSLLSSGVTGESGRFEIGDVVSIVDGGGKEFARGLTNFSSHELGKIKGLKSHQIKETLGYKYYDEIVHRDNLVIL